MLSGFSISRDREIIANSEDEINSGYLRTGKDYVQESDFNAAETAR